MITLLFEHVWLISWYHYWKICSIWLKDDSDRKWNHLRSQQHASCSASIYDHITAIQSTVFSILVFDSFIFCSIVIKTYPLSLIRCLRQQMAPGLWSLAAQTWDLLPDQWTKSQPASSWLEPNQRPWSRCWWFLKRKCAVWRRKRYWFLSVSCQLKHN